MSTRVQKGGTVFRPVAKPRARGGSEARQTPHTPEQRASVPPSNHSANTNYNASMPPPSTVPPKPHLSDSTRPVSAPTPPITDRSQGATTTISTPSRDSTRPPTVQILPPRSSVPPSQDSPRHTPTAIATPSSGAVRPPYSARTESASILPFNPTNFTQRSTPPIHEHAIQSSQSGLSSISDAQIDPALLEAVVTALRHVDENQSTRVDSVTQPAQRLALNTDTAVKVPSQRARRSRNRAEITPIAEEDDSLEPRRLRPRHKYYATDDEDASSVGTTRRRSRRRSTEGPENEDGEDGGHSGSAGKRSRRSRAPSLPPYDPDVDPGEEIDPTAITMADLCDDLGRGKVSSKAAQIVSNHATWRATNRDKRARLRAIAEARKYGRNLEEEENADSSAGPTEKIVNSDEHQANALQPTEASSSQVDGGSTEGQKGDDFDYTQAMSTSRFNVQVRIGPNGETIIDEASLFVERQEEDETVGYTHIEESDTSKFINSSTYSKKLRGSRWSAEETELFYDALQQFGENYELISYILPGRDRKACKNKFKAEDKRNPNRINHCLKNRRPYDMQTLSRMTGKDFSGPAPIIKSPTPPRLPDENTLAGDHADADDEVVRKQSVTPATVENEEIISNIED